MYTIAITGGIGSGKSVVSTVLRIMGYPVYDSDSEAKKLMDESLEIRQAIANRISPDAITPDGHIDRQRLARIVFTDKSALATLNSIVHSSVRDHFDKWRQQDKVAFIETAILYQSRLDQMVNEVWDVIAPTEVRINRVMKRNGITAEQVRARIEAQQFIPDTLHPNVHTITNAPDVPVLPQIIALLPQIGR
ncbi:MAG: dephospho-CoA kinase [Muribaculaceae bacterium]|nr:dephospho-CoA kinase [Muribaculaceae bacterium]